MDYTPQDFPAGQPLRLNPIYFIQASTDRGHVVSNLGGYLLVESSNQYRWAIHEDDIRASQICLFVKLGEEWPRVPSTMTPPAAKLTPLAARKGLVECLRKTRSGSKTCPVPALLVSDVMELLTYLEEQLAAR